MRYVPAMMAPWVVVASLLLGCGNEGFVCEPLPRMVDQACETASDCNVDCESYCAEFEGYTTSGSAQCTASGFGQFCECPCQFCYQRGDPIE